MAETYIFTSGNFLQTAYFSISYSDVQNSFQYFLFLISTCIVHSWKLCKNLFRKKRIKQIHPYMHYLNLQPVHFSRDMIQCDIP